MFTITVIIKGNKEVQAKLRKLRGGLTNMRTAMESIGGELESYYANEAFRSQGGVFQQRWRELNPTYQRRKLKRWGSRPLLVASGQMQKSFYHKADNTSVIITNLSKQFKYHQSSAPRYALPRRQMIGVNSRVKTIVKTIIQDDIAKKIRGA